MTRKQWYLFKLHNGEFFLRFMSISLPFLVKTWCSFVFALFTLCCVACKLILFAGFCTYAAVFGLILCFVCFRIIIS